jgi:UDP-N-acetylglucosamine--N-acetylmuramyl-(pentapeptide) pyrophosphoryl-undecaprenol N-acetylglucosamine transferase
MAGGGTGGHVYPAIAIADALRAQAPMAAVEFAGTQERLEWTAVPKAGYAIHPITVSGFQRRLSARNLAFPFKLLKGFKQSWDLVDDFDADVVVGTGGYVSGPVLLAASLRGRPIVVQEQNAYPGVTNRLLARRAAQIHIAFPEARQWLPAETCRMSGNPTRKELLDMDCEAARAFFDVPDDARMLLVFGGSLGSRALNTAMETHLDALLADEQVVVLWQTGAHYFEALQARVPSHPRLRLQQYIDRMDYAYAAADLALCRAGAITCSELMVTGTPAILVPSPNVAEDHQTKNAKSMTTHGAGLLLPETDLDARLVPTVQGLLADAARRTQMADAARSIARSDAADTIATDILSLIDRPTNA